MITEANFKKVLISLDFIDNNGIYSKKVNGHSLQADFANRKLTYPKGVTIEGEFTTNFSDNENFVVFECVHQLLHLGYKPEHLILEPKWKLGHGASGGRADIVIKDNNEDVFAIIECKTAGKEFEEAWSVALQYPSQLFSYAQQEGSTQLLCLYTSDLEGDNVQTQYYVIPLIDNENLLEATADEDPLTYTEAKRFDEKFNVWKNTYHSESFSKGLFEEGSQPFQFGRKNYSINDLKEIAHADIQKKYHQFATILRKYNVSGRENAFDKLVNLFLCKVVDEQQNPTNLGFYWKGRAYDDDFQLQDRLQRLYQQGMKQFLDEDVTYINQEQIDEAFRFLERDNDPDATKETINKYFKQLKFFTNNDFAFIDVHNERLFAENANVLRSIVEMLQDIRLKSDKDEHNNQFLGDMFEGFLDAGVKQSEGQFFTPMPIVKFLINSLPLEDIIIKSEQPPKAIDYACGAGHFLTELARQMKPIVKTYKAADERAYYSNITGLEKEYRLSKVAKVSAFMYGQDEINIIYADALARNNELQNGTYNILVANPPYSVKGFLETLRHVDRKAFELFGSVDEKAIITNNSIETFFIERAKQLLAPDGVAAIILPSSVLSNDAQLYRQARQIILQHFHLIAIAELGSGTFGKTGTNTVTLFLKRRKADPDEATHYRYRVRHWIENGKAGKKDEQNKRYGDLHLLEAYCAHVGLDYNNYVEFLQKGEPGEALQQTEIWKEYSKAFYDRADIKAWQRKPAFKALSEEVQQKDLAEMLCRHVRRIEGEKLYYYLLAQSNAVPVLVIKSPAERAAIKKFLGYTWSSAKGKEGIKYLKSKAVSEEKEDEEKLKKDGKLFDDDPHLVTSQLNFIRTPLYNPNKKNDAEKLNYYIIENFLGKSFALPEDLSGFVHKVQLANMLDFNRNDFSKAISLADNKTEKEIQTKYPKVRVENALVKIEGAQTKIQEDEIQDNGKYPVITQEAVELISGYTNSPNPITDVPLIIFGDHNCVFKYIDFPFVRGADGTQLLKPDKEKFLIKCFYYLIEHIPIQNRTKYERHYKYLSKGLIPEPPKDVQKKIVEECEKVDKALNEARQIIRDVKKKIEKKVSQVSTIKAPLKNFVEPVTNSIDPTKQKGEVVYVGLENIEKNTGVLIGEIQHQYSSIESVKSRFLPGDILYGKLRPNLNKVYLSEHEGICSTDILVLRPKESRYAKLLSYYMLNDEFKIEAVQSVAGLRMPRTSWEKIENIKVPTFEGGDDDLVNQVEVLEAQIATARQIIENAPAQKQVVLRKWLE